MLKIINLHAACADAVILKGVDLEISPGEIHAIMGPNGAGKSTLSRILAGDPSYEILSGEIEFEGVNILELEPEERAHLGLFVGFQYPLEIPGINNQKFLHLAYNAKQKAMEKPEITEEEFETILSKKLELLEMSDEVTRRGLNEGFSGGEKKRNEILQMAVLDPKMAILDETDSGLDIDALRIVACGVKRLFSRDKGLLLITHYERLLEYIRPNHVHIMIDGKIVESDGPDLAKKVEAEGYDWLNKVEA